MNSSEERANRPAKVKETESVSNLVADDAGNPAGIMKFDETNENQSVQGENLPDAERAKLQWEFEKFLANFTFFSTLV